MDCREVTRSRGLLSGYLTVRWLIGLNLGQLVAGGGRVRSYCRGAPNLNRRSALVCRGPVAIHHQRYLSCR